jgi:large subunit ribosomal protein L23
VFEVHTEANKIQIRKAVEKLFSVKVAAVNTARVHGKHASRRRDRAASRLEEGVRQLEEGDAIELF